MKKIAIATVFTLFTTVAVADSPQTTSSVMEWIQAQANKVGQEPFNSFNSPALAFSLPNRVDVFEKGIIIVHINKGGYIEKVY